jgi:succinate dehydrogenase / fumarate reductase cytochrome b subunit
MLVPRSSLGSKYLMALTGLGLTAFVIAHMLGNLQLFEGREALNSYAQKLKEMPIILWTARLGLLAIFVLHIVYGVRLWLANRAARPVPYHYKTYREASLASRTMLVTGLVILAFVVFHLLHYTFGLVARAPVKEADNQVTYTNYLKLEENAGTAQDPKYRHDVYEMTVYGFRNPLISLVYVLAMAFLCFHISHGFQSLFQSLGLNHPRWMPRLKAASLALAGLLFVGNSSMPLAVLLGLVGGDVP